MPIHQTARTFGARRVPTVTAASGCWQLGEVTQARRADIWPTGIDPFFSEVELLLPMDGTNASTTFTDASDNGLTVTANGNAAISTSESKFGGASAAFDGTGDYLAITHNAAIALGSDAFTIECWVFPTITPTSAGTIYGKRASAGTFAGVNIVIAATTLAPQLIVSFNGSTWGILSTSSVALTENEWNHLAVVRNGSQWNLYVNGVSGISATTSSSVYDDGSNATMGAAPGAAFPFTGYIDDFRITKGTNGARYTAAFTPPTAPHPTS